MKKKKLLPADISRKEFYFTLFQFLAAIRQANTLYSHL